MHPLTPNLDSMSDADLQKKQAELTTKMNAAYRMGNPALIGQLQMLLDDYNQEITTRSRKQLEELLNKNNKFSDIIDIK